MNRPSSAHLRLILCILSFVFLFNPICARQVDSIRTLPPFKWSRARKLDIKHIALDLRFDWKAKQALGVAKITLSLLKAGNTVELDAAQLTIRSISIGENSSLTFQYDGSDRDNALHIQLDRVYAPTEEIILRIDYHTNWVNTIDPNNLGGVNGKGLRFSVPTTNDPVKPREIYSVGEPQSNRYWFPCYDAPNDLRSTDITATIDHDLTVISNGDLLATTDNANGTHTFHWRMERPYANHLTSIVIGEYREVVQRIGDLSLYSYGYPKEYEATRATVERLPDMLRYFQEKSGISFPYHRYSQVFVQDLPNWMGNAGMSTITENMVDDQGTHDDFLYLWDQTEAEALAFQWFGSSLSFTDWSESWLSRAFPRYMNCLYNEYKNGRDEFLLYVLSFDQSNYLADWKAGYRHPIVTRNYDDVPAFMSDNYGYGTGAAVLHMLRKHLGDEVWWKAINIYLKNNTGRMVTTHDFIRAVEEASGEPMDWFFDQWVYRIGHPVFEVTKNFDSLSKQLTISVKQLQQTDSVEAFPQVGLFGGKVLIEIDERMEELWIEPKRENVFRFTLERKPSLVHFDYEGTWLKELIYEKPLEELLYQLQHDRDILGRQWALSELGRIAGEAATSPAAKEKIRQSLRNSLAGNGYWRFRISVLQLLRRMMPLSSDQSIILDKETEKLIVGLVRKERSWLKSALIGVLGLTRNNKYDKLYLDALRDPSDRVIAAAATALGRSKGKDAFQALSDLVKRPSMKSQSLLSALNGLKELKDPRGYDIAYRTLADPHLLRWRLPMGGWDYRVSAAQLIKSLGRSRDAYPLISERFRKAMEEDDLDGIFNNAYLVSILGDARGQELFELLKSKYAEDSNALNAVTQFEQQFRNAITTK